MADGPDVVGLVVVGNFVIWTVVVRAFGYPLVPALYIVGAATILATLFVYRTSTTWPGLIIVLLGIPVYFLWTRLGGNPAPA